MFFRIHPANTQTYTNTYTPGANKSIKLPKLVLSRRLLALQANYLLTHPKTRWAQSINKILNFVLWRRV